MGRGLFRKLRVGWVCVPARTDWRALGCVIDGRAPEGQGASHATVCVSRGSACLAAGSVYVCVWLLAVHAVLCACDGVVCV
jgi:hypothetical protein